jgi:membrane protease YdiL (CAAX protease family)
MPSQNVVEQAEDRYLGWKTLGGLVVTLAFVWVAYAVWAVGIRFVRTQLNIPFALSNTVNRLGGIALTIGVSALASRAILKRCLSEIAFRRHRGWWADLLFGALLSSVAMFVLYAIYIGNGWLIVEGWHWQAMPFGAWLGVLWGSVLSCAQAAIGEEAIFRGYALTGLKEAWGQWTGLIVMAAVFAAMHLFVGGAEKTPLPLFILALMGPGLLLGWAYLRSGSLWLAIGIHFAWNLVQGELLNLPGNTNSPHVFGARTQLQGPTWLVGTEYGIEVGLLSVVVLGIVFAGVWLWTKAPRDLDG